MFVLTVDQQTSTQRGDQVEDLLRYLAGHGFSARTGAVGEGLRPGVVLGFERTVGDEVQAVLDSAEPALDAVLDLLRVGGWSIGLGVGAVAEPLPTTSRAASGPAFVHARAAVERARSRAGAVALAVVGPDPGPAREVEALLRLVGAVVARRTAAGWEAVDALAHGAATQKDVAEKLGVSEQAISQRLRTALWNEQVAVRPLALRLLAELGE